MKVKIELKDLVKYSIEALIVTFGVVLGLILTEHFTQLRSDKNTEIALNQIIDEIDLNLKSFEKAFEYHNSLREQIDSVYGSLTTADMEKQYYSFKKFRHNNLNGWTGLGTANYEYAIYESAKMNGVYQELNIETIKIIAQVYTAMKSYDEFQRMYLNNFLSVNSQSTVMDMLHLLLIMRSDMIYFENQIVERLKETKAKLEQATLNNTYKK